MHPKSSPALQLRDLQQDFSANLTAKRLDPIFLGLLKNARDLSTVHPFSIYVNNRRAGLLKALANTYPVCQKLVGEQYFRRMVNPYVEQCPSYSPSLNDYGFGLADALLDSPFVLELPYLIDIIRLEWHIHCILIGADEWLFDWGKLTLIPSSRYADLIFHRPGNSVLIHSPFPVDRIWETNQVDFTGNDHVDLTEGAVYLFVGRSRFDIRIERLTALQWTILTAIDGKRSLEELRIILAGKVEEQAIIESLPALIKAGYIAKFDMKLNLN
ncbi:MAG TPA: DNA-binding domain-containing protein [Gammaproteobacteria bacterium]|nr:DNA-binding domain-containing protein [Gammaproteobacteria bacterium]